MSDAASEPLGGIPPGMWARMPDWLKSVIVVLGLLGGGGGALASFVRPSIVAALDVVPADDYAKDIKAFKDRFDKLEKQQATDTNRIIGEVWKARGRK